MAQDNTPLPEGLRFFPKHQNAPDFVIGTMVVTPAVLSQFCKDHPELMSDYQGTPQLKLQLLTSQQGKLYAKVDTYKANTPAQPSNPTRPVSNEPINHASEPDDLPF